MSISKYEVYVCMLYVCMYVCMYMYVCMLCMYVKSDNNDS